MVAPFSGLVYVTAPPPVPYVMAIWIGMFPVPALGGTMVLTWKRPVTDPTPHPAHVTPSVGSESVVTAAGPVPKVTVTFSTMHGGKLLPTSRLPCKMAPSMFVHALAGAVAPLPLGGAFTICRYPFFAVVLLIATHEPVLELASAPVLSGAPRPVR